MKNKAFTTKYLKIYALITICLLLISVPAINAYPTAEGDPWPMFHQNMKHTGQSQYVGPHTNNIKWIADLKSESKSSPVIGADGTIYTGCISLNPADPDGLTAVDPNGEIKWIFASDEGAGIYNSPAISPNGNIYFSENLLTFFTIKPDGTEKWHSPYDQGVKDKLLSSPIIDNQGSVYFGINQRVIKYEIGPNGFINSTETFKARHNGLVTTSPSISEDGTLYFGSIDSFIYAYNPDGSLKWEFKANDSIESSPAIGSDGTIYFGSDDDFIYAINPDGTLKWKYKTENNVFSSPAIGTDGTIYFGSDDHYIYAINPDGTLKWKYKTENAVWSSPAIGADGTIYVGSNDGNVYAIYPNGTLNWILTTDIMVDASPSIGADGTLYVVNRMGELYAICDK